MPLKITRSMLSLPRLLARSIFLVSFYLHFSPFSRLIRISRRRSLNLSEKQQKKEGKKLKIPTTKNEDKKKRGRSI
jgi:hypothetical protein